MANKYNYYKGRGKFWDNESHIYGKNFKRINEDQWFKSQQNLLLWMANTSYGRELLCIPKFFPKIIEISKKHITGFLGLEKDKVKLITDFRVGAKWANIIRYRWQEFQEYAQEYYAQFYRSPILFPVVPIRGYAFLTSTFLPDPSTGNTTVDGIILTNKALGSGVTWASIHDAANGDQTDATAATTQWFQFTSDNVSAKWRTVSRGILTFDSSSLGSTATITATTFTIVGAASKTDTLSITGDIDVYTSTPAANNSLAVGDYSQTGTTSQTGSPITYANWSSSAGNTWTFNGTGRGNVSKTGVSKFAVKNANYDAANSAPAWTSASDNWVTGNTADATGTANDPALLVTYTKPAGGGLLLLGAGS